MKAYILDRSKDITFKYRIISYFKEYVKSISDEIVDDYESCDYVLSFYSEDNYASLIKYKHDRKIKAFAFIDGSDLSLSSKDLSLSINALNFYYKVDEVLVFSTFEREFLESLDVKNITLVKRVTTEKRELTDIEKKTFLTYFQLEGDKDIVLSFGKFKDKREFDLFDTIARNALDKCFIYIGFNDREFLKTSMVKRIIHPNNVYYLENLPEELYYPMLNSVSILFIASTIISNPIVMFDFVNYKIPIVSNKNMNMKYYFNDKTIRIADSYEKLFLALQNVKKID